MRPDSGRILGHDGAVESPSTRSLQVLALLQSGREWTLREVAHRLGVSDRTVRRDVRRLRGLGYDVHSSPGPGGAYRLRPGVKIPPLLLDADEVSTIVTGLLVLESFAPGDTTAAAARSKLEQVLPPHLRRRAAATALATQVLGAEPVRADWPCVGVLAEAIAAGERARFDYTDQRGRESERLVEPYRSVLRRGHWYLVAYDLDRDDWRVFRLDRIREPVAVPGQRAAHRFPWASIEDWLTSDFAGGA